MEEKITYKTAKLAKLKGYDVKYDNIEMYGVQVVPQLEPFNDTRWRIYRDYHLAPTQSFLQKWLRDTHDIHVEVNIDVRLFGEIKKFFYSISHEGNYFNGVSDVTDVWYGIGGVEEDENYHLYDSFEEALEIGLEEGLKLIKTNE